MSKKARRASHTKQNQSPESGSRSWIQGPALDLIVGCGAWSAPLLLLAYPLAASDKPVVSVAFYALALVFNYPHFMATIYRGYRTREEFSRYRWFTLHATVLMFAAMILVHWAYGLVAWVFTIYITWSPWHYTGQNFGLAMMFAKRNDANASRAAARALRGAFWASYAVIFISFHTGPSSDQYLISLNLSKSFAVPASVVLIFIFAVLGIWSIWSVARRVGLRPLVPVVLLLGTQALWFVAPVVWQLASGTNVPQTRYSSGILAVMHSAQYLWITSYYAKRESEASGRNWRPWAYFGALFVGGIALFIPGPWLVSYVFKFDFVASFLIFTALINIHHFVLDGAIWKLRDGRVAALLIDTKKQISSQAAFAGNSLIGTLRWFFAPSLLSRAVRIAVIGALVILAGVDVAKFYLGSDESNEARLARAESLNPYDQSLLLRLARAHGQDGQLDETIATLERAVLVNPKNPGPQNQLARLLIENQRYDRAFVHYEQMLRHVPRDVDALVNFGILAVQLKRDDRAIESWERAITLDPEQKNILRYLADAYDRQGKSEQATLNYERYLAVLSRQTDRLDPREVISLTLKLAEEYARQDQFDRALAYGQNAASLASQAGEKAMLSASYSVLAQLNNEMGRRGEAMVLHQRAIQLDRDIGDSHQEGLDWFKFAQTMRHSRKPSRLVLASLLRAERLLSSNPGTEFEMVVDARRQEEATAGKEGAIAETELESILSDLLVAQP